MNKRKRWDERKEYCFIYPKICLNLRDSTVEEVSRLYMVLGFVHNYGLGVELLCRGTHFCTMDWKEWGHYGMCSHT